MPVPKYWARATTLLRCRLSWVDFEGEVVKWGSSDRSPAHAEEEARRLVEELAARVRDQRAWPDQQAGYDLYNLANPIRERIVEVLQAEPDDPLGLITRNRYGCQVLNTHRVAFVDIDEAPPAVEPVPFFERIRRLFVSPPPAQPRPPATGDELPQQLRDFSRSHPTWGLRVYRTAAGWRVLITHSLFDPSSSLFQEAMERMGADPLYIRLCRGQKLFRARISPKPWRVGCPSADALWPAPDAQEERRMEEWVRHYVDACRGKAVCRFLSHLGPDGVGDDAIARIIQVHDRHCLANSASLA